MIERDEFDSAILELFIEAKIPVEASVFWDPMTAALRMYASDEAKRALAR